MSCQIASDDRTPFIADSSSALSLLPDCRRAVPFRLRNWQRVSPTLLEQLQRLVDGDNTAILVEHDMHVLFSCTSRKNSSLRNSKRPLSSTHTRRTGSATKSYFHSTSIAIKSSPPALARQGSSLRRFIVRLSMIQALGASVPVWPGAV